MPMKRVKFFISLLPAIIFLFTLPQSVCMAAGESKTLNITKDTYANQAYPGQNRGTLDSIIISNKYTIRLGYLQFENLDLPEGVILDKGILNFHVNEVHYSDEAKVNIGPITSNWDETTVTWNNKPTINQSQAIEVGFTLTATGGRELNITPIIRQWLEGTENKGLFIYPYGFLYGTAETEYAFTFKSKESGTQRANIVVKYHFEPSPSPSPIPSPSPSPTISPSPTPIGEEKVTPSPTPEASPSPSPEAEEEKGLILGFFSTGQAIIGGLIILALIGAGIAFVTYSRQPGKKSKKKSAKAKPAEDREKSEEKEEES